MSAALRARRFGLASLVSILLHWLLAVQVLPRVSTEWQADGVPAGRGHEADVVAPDPPAAPALTVSAAGAPVRELAVGWRDPPAAGAATTSSTGGDTPAGPASSAAGESEYAQRVRQHLARFLTGLPAGAHGEARVQFTVRPDGQVGEIILSQSSGHAGLDAVARALPARAVPLPLPGPVAQRLEVPIRAVSPAGG